MQHQRDGQQEHQRLDSLGRLQPHRSHGDRAFEVSVDLLAVDLLFEPREEVIGTRLVGRDRGHDRIEAVVLFVGGFQRGVERELESLRG